MSTFIVMSMISDDHTIVPLEIEEYDDETATYINANFITVSSIIMSRLLIKQAIKAALSNPVKALRSE